MEQQFHIKTRGACACISQPHTRVQTFCSMDRTLRPVFRVTNAYMHQDDRSSVCFFLFRRSLNRLATLRTQTRPATSRNPLLEAA